MGKAGEDLGVASVWEVQGMKLDMRDEGIQKREMQEK